MTFASLTHDSIPTSQVLIISLFASSSTHFKNFNDGRTRHGHGVQTSDRAVLVKTGGFTRNM
ncbi:hypothetical protein B0H12DRAFT_1136360 [Mycena haematopus]|nr:hypothetical protein B0H12DRAFT_1136360 [Mycena haematopus]